MNRRHSSAAPLRGGLTRWTTQNGCLLAALKGAGKRLGVWRTNIRVARSRKCMFD